MTQKNLLTLVIVLSVLVGIFFLTQPGYERTDDQHQIRLFSDIDGGKISKIVIEQGNSNIELSSGVPGHDGWIVPARANYPADTGKINSLLLKILDLSVSQKVTENEQKFDQLGVTDPAVKNGKGKVTLHDKENHILGGLFLGELRKGKGSSGQFIRRFGADNSGRKEVYLIAEPINASTDLANWLDTTVANVLQSELEGVTQFKVTNNREEKEFELKKTEKKGPVPEFTLDPPLSGDEQMNAVNFSQVRSALENLRLNDVLQSSDPQLKELVFDKKTVSQLSNGLTYTVLTAQKEPEKCYGKISVTFNQAFADAVKKQIEFSQEQVAKKKTADEQTKKGGGEVKPDQAATDGADNSTSTIETPKLSSSEEAQKLSVKYEPWVFQLQQYMCSKFRHVRSELVQAHQENAGGETSGQVEATTPKR